MAVDREEASRRGRGRSHKAAFFAPDSKAGCQLTGSIADTLAQLSDDVRAKVLRSAVHAGADVLYDELKTRAPKDGGRLNAAVYQWHDDKKSRDGRQVYAVGVNKVKAPHWFVTEYGHWRVNVVYRGPNGEVIPTKQRLPRPVWVPGHPYLRPTWDAKAGAAIEAMKTRAALRLRELGSAS